MQWVAVLTVDLLSDPGYIADTGRPRFVLGVRVSCTAQLGTARCPRDGDPICGDGSRDVGGGGRGSVDPSRALGLGKGDSGNPTDPEALFRRKMGRPRRTETRFHGHSSDVRNELGCARQCVSIFDCHLPSQTGNTCQRLGIFYRRVSQKAGKISRSRLHLESRGVGLRTVGAGLQLFGTVAADGFLNLLAFSRARARVFFRVCPNSK